MTKKEIFDIQEVIAHQAFNLGNWKKIVGKAISEGTVVGNTKKVDKSQIIDALDSIHSILCSISETLRGHLSANNEPFDEDDDKEFACDKLRRMVR